MPRLGDGTQPVFVRSSARATKFTDSCDVLGLTQFVSMPTRCRNVLDLVLARGFIDVTAQPRPSTIISDHDEVVISLNVKSPPPIRATRAAAFYYRRADFDGLRRALRATPWDMLDNEESESESDVFRTLPVNWLFRVPLTVDKFMALYNISHSPHRYLSRYSSAP